MLQVKVVTLSKRIAGQLPWVMGPVDSDVRGWMYGSQMGKDYHCGTIAICESEAGEWYLAWASESVRHEFEHVVLV